MRKEKKEKIKKTVLPREHQEVIQPPKKKKKTYYLTNKNLLPEVIESREKGKISDKLARMFQLLAKRYATQGRFFNYTYSEDMQAYALLMLVRTWRGFDPNRGSNPFAFYTQCIKNSFRQYLNMEKKHRDTRDILLVDKGLEPSYSYSIEHKKKEDEEKLKRAEEKDVNVIKKELKSKKSNKLLSY